LPIATDIKKVMSQRSKERKTLKSLAKIIKELATIIFQNLKNTYERNTSKKSTDKKRGRRKSKKSSTKKVWKPTGRVIPVSQQISENTSKEEKMRVDDDSSMIDNEEYSSADQESVRSFDSYDSDSSNYDHYNWDKEEYERIAEINNAWQHQQNLSNLPMKPPPPKKNTTVQKIIKRNNTYVEESDDVVEVSQESRKKMKTPNTPADLYSLGRSSKAEFKKKPP
jgi:hypothetical protein